MSEAPPPPHRSWRAVLAVLERRWASSPTNILLRHPRWARGAWAWDGTRMGLMEGERTT